MKNVIASILLFLLPNLVFAQDFSDFQTILSKYLKVTDLPGGGLQTAFDYSSLKSDLETMKLVESQATKLASFDIKTLDTKNKATAFWINAYNFNMIKIVLDKGFDGNKRKINSVKDLGSFFSPYKIFKEEIINIGGKNYSLDGIEKGTLLADSYKKKGWKDARIHFAVNCASVGCPPLIANVYTAATLDQALDDNIRKAFKTPRHLKIKNKELYLTHLFKWYKKDFEEHSGSVKGFIKKYVDAPAAIDATDDIEHIDYDWKLNRPANF